MHLHQKDQGNKALSFKTKSGGKSQHVADDGWLVRSTAHIVDGIALLFDTMA